MLQERMCKRYVPIVYSNIHVQCSCTCILNVYSVIFHNAVHVHVHVLVYAYAYAYTIEFCYMPYKSMTVPK